MKNCMLASGSSQTKVAPANSPDPKSPGDERNQKQNRAPGSTPVQNSQVIKITKACTKCGVEQSLREFHKNSSKSDGRQAQCKTCVSKAKKKQYKAKTSDSKRKQKQADDFKVELCGIIGDDQIENFSNVFAEAIKELIENGKL